MRKFILAGIFFLLALAMGMTVWILNSDATTFSTTPVLKEGMHGLHPAAYLAPKSALNDSQPLVADETMEWAGITPVDSEEELQRLMARYPELAVIYLHPDVVAETNDAWLRNEYQRGIVIVGLNTPLSTLATKLGVRSEVPDFRVERVNNMREGALYFSWLSTYHGRLQGASTGGHGTYWALNIDDVPWIINHDAAAIARVKNESTVPGRIVRSEISTREKFGAFFHWIRNGCPWREC